SLCNVHIACMGIEKLIPKHRDLSVFLRLLARSATGQPITTYSSHFMGPIPGGELHIVLVDNGRTAHLGEKQFSSSLSCIRCGACMNTCPVYRRSGGYSYNYTIPGPIGSILAPLRSLKEHSSLPFASSLCGSCTDVCPVKINLHQQLLNLRKRIVEANEVGLLKKASMKITAKILTSSFLFDLTGIVGRIILKYAPRVLVYNKLNIWGRARDLPQADDASFKEIYQKKYFKVIDE
nr:lactate utilization protein [Pseudomonadota bacterium]